MIRPTPDDVKRKIDSKIGSSSNPLSPDLVASSSTGMTGRMMDRLEIKIFEVQSSLLEENVPESLLRECVVWFRPSHLRDIIIERSEAERVCGWPPCHNPVPSWAKTATLVFDLPGGEEAGRFCGKPCATKSKVLLASIPSTSPYSRDAALRLTCPELFGPRGGTNTVTKSEKGAATGQKKVYKRARRRDIPRAVPSGASGHNDRQQPPLEAQSTPGEGHDKHLAPETHETENEVEAQGAAAVEEKSAISPHKARLGVEASITQSDARRGEQELAADCEDTAFPGSVTPGFESENRDATEDPVDNTCEAAYKRSSHSEGGNDKISGKGPLQRTPEDTPKSPEKGLTAEEGPNDDPSWESLSLNSVGSKTTVSLHASLATAARGKPGRMVHGTTQATPADRTTPQDGGMEKTTPLRQGQCKAQGQGQGQGQAQQEAKGQGQAQGQGQQEVKGSTTGRKKGVSFAAGTKNCPPSNLLNKCNNVAGTAYCESVSTSMAPAVPVNASNTNMKMGDRGSGCGKRGGGRAGGGSKPTRTTKKTSPTVVGDVVERPLVPPAKMQTPAANGASDRGNGQLAEGHMSRIESDMSFHVFPRGYNGPGPTKVPDAEVDDIAATSDAEDTNDDLPHCDDDILDDEGDEEYGNEEDEENDRAIWREDFGEEMPPDVAEGSWINMEAVGDKAMREEFASTIGVFPLLWGALSELVTPITRTICRAARVVAAKARSIENAVVEDDLGALELAGDSQSPFVASPGTPNLRARRAGVVAEAMEVVAYGHPREGGGKDAKAITDEFDDSVTVTSAMRHNGVSTMVNMYLTQAERALRVGEGGTPSKTSGGQSQAWLWAAEGSEAKRGARSGAWVAETREKSLDASVTRGGRAPCSGDEKPEAAGSGGAQTRRAIAALVDTFDAAPSTGAPELSITQWKVVCVVLLTAIGLGGCGPKVASVHRQDHGEGSLVESVEAKLGAEACTRLCGNVSVISEREFQLLVEVLLDE